MQNIRKLSPKYALYLSAVVFILVIIGSAVFLLWPANDNETDVNENDTQLTANLEITSSTQDEDYELKFQEGENAFQAIENLQDSNEDFTFTYTVYDFGNFITGFNGETASETQFWEFSVNETPSGTGAGDHILQQDDQLKFELKEF